MVKYLSQRIIYLLITLFLISSFTFFLMKFLPGTPFRNQQKLSPEQIHILNEKYGLNDPVPVQYVKYMGKLAQGDLGISFQFDNQSVTHLILNRMGPSLQLGIQAMILGTLIGIILGMLAAMFQNSWIDYGSTLIAILGVSIPSFVFAAALQYFVGVKLQWLPVASWDGFSSTILPTIALAIGPVATAARFIRTELVDVLSSDYIVLAKAKGNSYRDIAFKHALRNALIPLITVLGPTTAAILTGSMVIEQIFSIPGIGEQFVKSIQMNDYPIIMGTTIFYSFVLVVCTLIVDILYGIIDPRIRLAGGNNS
ncbi:peptide ABC transporter permease [Weizmannia acidilactici]|uniref:Peptide ABC transporter permease n=1 Tax=Weizmannia acidilactici TaxID=2607726 RepID=A0A5J4JIV6_9BACI|nr:oligopeptide ABC transporter permease [Weizmannia acidilactici]GER67361.1 peptide ABC transporter permease [Weizmannia acidilactici]GER70460.1 peptide ABC transporter permease [Weizmannia acidilactici]GER72639.1 peptide ABC transporter permease [Weizmannia acidilactici]